MEKQIIADRAPLQEHSPLDYVQEERAAGSSTMELGLAEKAPISHSAYALNPINAGTQNPVKQFLGSEAPLDNTPRHGYESGTPMSRRSIKQSE